MSYKQNYNLIDWSKEIVIERKAELPPARSDLPFPMIASDYLAEPVQSMVDGTWHTSKAGLRKTYSPSGNEEGVRYIEIGNDPARLKQRERKKVDRKAVKTTLEKAAARFNRGERVSKAPVSA